MIEVFIVFLIPPVTVLMAVVLVLATFGKSLGVREFYADTLIKIFEWGASAYGEEHEIVGDDEVEERPGERRRLKRSSSSDLAIIKREKSEVIETKLHDTEVPSEHQSTVRVVVNDSLDFITAGVEAIIEDQVTSRFKAEQLPSWNLLTRTKYSFQHLNWKLTLLWAAGFFFRYFFLVPLRVIVFAVGFSLMLVLCFIIGYVPNPKENRAENGGICVANHTSPIDVLILSTDNCYAMIGQRQGGILGTTSLPETFTQIGSTIYPIAMKYDSRLTDCFWNSSEQSYGEYLWRMMTSWAIICDVWYLPKMTKEDGEDAIAFARRVKKAIAKKGGLVDLEWDGMLKRERVSSKLIQLHQKLYYERLQRTTSIGVISEGQTEALELMQVGSNLPSTLLQQLSDDERNELLRELDDSMDEAALLKKVNEYGPIVRKRLQSSAGGGELPPAKS